MATQSHLYQGIYTGAHIKEGVQQLIYQVVPEDTPGMNMFGRGSATNVQHEWLQRRRGSRVGAAGQHRAVPPGEQFNVTSIETTATDDFEDVAVPSRIVNYCEIFRVLPRVDESTLAAQFHGITDIMADQVEFYAANFAIYIEDRVWNGVQDAGPTGIGDTTAWQMGGLVASISDNFIDLDTAAIVDNDLQNIFNKCWADGGRPQDLFCGANVKATMVDALGSNFTKFIDQNERGIVNTLSFYEGATQTISVHLTRDLEDAAPNTADTSAGTGNRVLLIDRSSIRLAWYREPFMERLPRMGGDERARIEGQVTLEFGDERAHGELRNMQIPTAITR